MTVTMDNAAKTLREVVTTYLTGSPQPDLCLDKRDIETIATLVSEDRSLLMMTALGGMGHGLVDSLGRWFSDYRKTRMAWLTRHPKGRAVLKERAPEVYARLIRDEREHKARVKQARRIRKTAYA